MCIRICNEVIPGINHPKKKTINHWAPVMATWMVALVNLRGYGQWKNGSPRATGAMDNQNSSISMAIFHSKLFSKRIQMDSGYAKYI